MIASSFPTTVAVFEALCTAVAAASAVYVAMRDARWRRNGLAKQLSDRIEAAQKAATEWDETEKGRRLFRDVDGHGRRIQSAEDALSHTASKLELGKLERELTRAVGMVERVEQKVTGAADGIDRIEGLLLKRALRADA